MVINKLIPNKINWNTCGYQEIDHNIDKKKKNLRPMTKENNNYHLKTLVIKSKSHTMYHNIITAKTTTYVDSYNIFSVQIKYN